MVPVRILSQPQVFQLFGRFMVLCIVGSKIETRTSFIDSIIIALSGSDSMKMHAIKIFEVWNK
jgi:hypothetical protein